MNRMHILRRLIALGIGLILIAPALAATLERTWLQYGELSELYEKFDSIPPDQRRGLQLRLRLDPSVPVPPGSLRLFLASTSGRVEVPVQGEHLLALPRGAELRKEDPAVLLQAPPGVKVGLAVEVSIDLPSHGARTYGDWMVSVQQAAAGVRRHAGFWALFMPKAMGLEMRFARGEVAVATLEAPGGTRQWQADANGRLIVPLEPDLLAVQLPLRLSRPPLLAMPYFKTSITLMPSGEAAIK